MPDENPALEESAKPAKKARKPRAPRKKKEAPPPVVEQDAAPAVVAEQESTHAADTDDTAERAAIQEEANGRSEAGIVNLSPAIVNQPTPDVDPAEVNGNGHELRGARPRANGDRPWAFDRTDPEHPWERLETADGRIAFRFKNEPTDEQMGLIEKYGFRYEPEEKRAYRANDIAGRTYAEKLAFFLGDLTRSQGAALSA